MSDPSDITRALDRAEDAFNFVGHGAPNFEEGINQEEDWKTQLTKACRYLEACRALRSQDGFNGATIELCFGAIERTLEGYILWDTGDDLQDFHDHEEIYNRVAMRGLFTRDTADNLQSLYSSNRSEHYYGGLVPTQQQADEMYELAEEIHAYVADQIREGGSRLCNCA